MDDSNTNVAQDTGINSASEMPPPSMITVFDAVTNTSNMPPPTLTTVFNAATSAFNMPPPAVPTVTNSDTTTMPPPTLDNGTSTSSMSPPPVPAVSETTDTTSNPPPPKWTPNSGLSPTPPPHRVVQINAAYRTPMLSHEELIAYYTNSIFILFPGFELPFIDTMPDEFMACLNDVRKLKCLHGKYEPESDKFDGIRMVGVLREYEFEVEIWEALAHEGLVEKRGRGKYYFLD